MLAQAVHVQPELVGKLDLFHDVAHALRGADHAAGLDVRRQVRE